MKEPIILVLLGLFLAVLVLRAVKSYFLARHLKNNETGIPGGADSQLLELMGDIDSPGKSKNAIQQIVRAAPRAKIPATRSAYYVAAGNLAISSLKRPKLAVGFYLKALRSDPTCLEALHKLQDILLAQKRYRRLEWTFWEVLSRLDDSEIGEEMWLECWAGLAAIFAASPRGIHKADAIRKALSAFITDDEDESKLDRISNIPKILPNIE